MEKNQKQKVLVAMSGGVDSAVAARLLKMQGHEVASVYVRTWEHEDDLWGDCPERQGPKGCGDSLPQVEYSVRCGQLHRFLQAGSG